MRPSGASMGFHRELLDDHSALKTKQTNMRLHIIQPSYYTDPVSRRLFQTTKLNLMPLTLPHLAALVPAGIEVALTDEKIQPVDFAVSCDCVFLSVWTLNSFRAYDLADAYRKQGIPVVMGGPHCFFHSEEAIAHADAVAIGEGETLIPEILDDLNQGSLKPLYRSKGVHDLRGLPIPRRDLLNPRAFNRFHTVAIQTTRGCPNACEFCAERLYLGSRYRMRPVGEVIEEIKSVKSKRVFFSDSTFAGNRARTMTLMERLIPLKIRWSALWTANRVMDQALMTLAKRSGLLHLNLGIESIKQDTLDGMNKRTTKADRLTEVIRRLRGSGISFSFNLIFGWDSDHKVDFQHTLAFLNENKVHAAFFNSLAPHKGTEIYERFVREGRILDPENMDRWPGIHAKIRPKNFSPEELHDGIRMMYKAFYSWPCILQRLPPPITLSALASWSLNLSQRKFAFGKRTNFDGY
jgi:radical SAM superfamily enzyme YgiQ (UPF0313 family)